jgi:hypothetical protein
LLASASELDALPKFDWYCQYFHFSLLAVDFPKETRKTPIVILNITGKNLDLAAQNGKIFLYDALQLRPLTGLEGREDFSGLHRPSHLCPGRVNRSQHQKNYGKQKNPFPCFHAKTPLPVSLGPR